MSFAAYHDTDNCCSTFHPCTPAPKQPPSVEYAKETTRRERVLLDDKDASECLAGLHFELDLPCARTL